MIAIGADHGGFELKEKVRAFLDEQGIAYKDFGAYSTDSVDYPDYAKKVGKAIQEGDCEQGILICSTGIGIGIAANKMKGIRAALCHDLMTARLTKEHNDSNVLVLGGLVVGPGLAMEIVKTFLDTPFSNVDRHQRRVNKIEEA